MTISGIVDALGATKTLGEYDWSISTVVLAFLCGGAYEYGCARWVAHAEARKPWPAVRWSVFNALVTVIGIESFLKGVPYVVAYVLGYATGTYLAVRPGKPKSYNETEDEENRRWQGRPPAGQKGEG